MKKKITKALRQGQGKVLIKVMVFTQHVRGGGGGATMPQNAYYIMCVGSKVKSIKGRYTHTHAIVAFSVKFTTVLRLKVKGSIITSLFPTTIWTMGFY